MALKIGITGGIGSGKSVVCDIFKCLGVPIFDADFIAKNILDESPIIKNELIRLFGTSIYVNNGTVDRKKLASIIFNNKFALRKVNGLVHPVVINKFHEWFAQQNSAYVLHEAAILMESDFYKMMDQNIVVVANEEIRIERVTRRDKVTREQVLERISRQWDDEKKIKIADMVIYNNNEMLIPQVLTINAHLVTLIENKK